MAGTTPADVGRWMLDEFERSRGFLEHEDAVHRIHGRFGNDFVYENENGNLAIARPVLAKFRKLTEDTVVWERGERVWPRREKHDPVGKRQAE